MKRAIALILVAFAADAFADKVAVKVVEVAGGLAYLDKGESVGIVRGTKLTFGRRVFVVVESTAATSVIEIGDAALAIGASGSADVKPGKPAAEPLPKPRPDEAFREQWPPAEVPARTQTPKPVALGGGEEPGNARVAVIAHGFAVKSNAHSDASGELRVVASFERIADRPLGADLDLAARGYRDGANKSTRTPLFVRAAQLRYGDSVAIGRLRYAASAIGMLDGARVSLQRGRFDVAAFGGVVPDPLSGKPESAARFGGEATFDDSASSWRPRISLATYGSTWEGKLDERRLAATASINRGELWLDGWAEIQTFPDDNPWNAHGVEVTGAGAAGQWRASGTHVGVDVTFMRPERSLRLAAALPREYLVGDAWTSASLSAGKRGAWWSVDALGSVGRSSGAAVEHDASGYVGGEVRFGPRRVFAGVSAGRAAFARWTAGTIGAGIAWDRLDVAAHYRPELLDYVAATEATTLHTGGLDLHVAATRDLDVALTAEVTRGLDRDILAILSTIIWRPLP